MADIGCVTVFTDEDDEMLRKAEKSTWPGLSPEIKEEVMPKVREVLKGRVIECLQEDAEKNRDELRRKIESEGRKPIPLEKIDLSVVPTEKEYKSIYKIGREMRMKDWELVNTPVVVGIKDPYVTGKIERLDNQKEVVEDTMKAIYTSKLSVRFKDVEAVDKILVVDKLVKGKGTYMKAGTYNKETYDKYGPGLSRTLFVFQDPELKEIPVGEHMKKETTHELCHLNMRKGGEFRKIFMKGGFPTSEWKRVSELQRETKGFGPVSERAKKNDEEWIAEHVAFWDAGLGVEIHPGMKKFFEKYLTDNE